MTSVTVLVDGVTTTVSIDKDEMGFEEFMELIAIPALAATWGEGLINDYYRNEDK